MVVIAYIGIGSNLNEPAKQVELAIKYLREHERMTIKKISSFYVTKPWGHIQNQPDFVNAVVEIETTCLPLDLLSALQAIETHMGRVREGEQWGPRVIDLDLLLYGNERIDLPNLTVPHPYLHEREFVLKPLFEIAPDLRNHLAITKNEDIV